MSHASIIDIPTTDPVRRGALVLCTGSPGHRCDTWVNATEVPSGHCARHRTDGDPTVIRRLDEQRRRRAQANRLEAAA